MINYIKTFFLVLGAVVLMSSCEEDLDKPMLNAEVIANVLGSLPEDSYTFTFETKDEVFNKFEWNAPDFGFEASVTYTIQMDTAGGGFGSPVNLGNTLSLTLSPTVGEVNNALLGMGLQPDESREVQFRVRSVINTEVDPIYSNVVSTMITPYLAAFPPIYIVGDAQSWDLGAALELSSTGPGTYEAVGLFQEGGKFRMFATPSWDAEQWGYMYFDGGTLPADLADGADGDSNFLFEGTTGVYKIVINLNTKTITMEAGELPTLYVIGDAQGWDLQQAMALTFLGGGKFEGTGTFQNGGYFRFFEKADWGATQYGFSHFAEGSVPTEFTDGGDGDSNFIFAGTTGEYTVTVDINSREIMLEVASDYPATLFLVGDDQGWTFANSPTFTNMGSGVFVAEAVGFTNGATFRFFEEADNWSDDYGAGFFTGGIDEELTAVGDGDDNFSFAGATGTYTITVSLSEMTIVVEPLTYPAALYLVGDDQSWTFANSPSFTSSSEGVFVATGVSFTNGSTFRFFEEDNNWNDSYGHAYFTEVDANLDAVGDNDDNFRFVGTDGAYTVTVDLTAKSVLLTQ